MSIQPTNLLTSVKTKNSLDTFIKHSVLIQNLINEIKSIPNYKTLTSGSKFLELIEHICNVVENQIDDTTSPDDKKQIVISIFQTLFQDANLIQIENQIEYLLNNKIIKSFANKSKLSYKVYKFFKKRL